VVWRFARGVHYCELVEVMRDGRLAEEALDFLDTYTRHEGDVLGFLVWKEKGRARHVVGVVFDRRSTALRLVDVVAFRMELAKRLSPQGIHAPPAMPVEVDVAPDLAGFAELQDGSVRIKARRASYHASLYELEEVLRSELGSDAEKLMERVLRHLKRCLRTHKNPVLLGYIYAIVDAGSLLPAIIATTVDLARPALRVELAATGTPQRS
jgi:hypothetical protein